MTMWIWLIVSVAMCAVGEYTAKQWSINSSLKTAMISLLFYTMGTAAWFPVLRGQNKLIVAWMLWAILSAFSTILIGLYFGESISSHQWIGMGLGLISIVLIAL